MKDNVFSSDFIWGAASASAQVEGGWNEDGRTPSIWDIAPSKKIRHGESCRIACDHYHHWKEDVAMMKEMGLKAYRFSISWSRVIPEEGVVNAQGLKFYSDLVDELIASGIEPMITIFHWDTPLWVYKKGGWLSSKVISLFAEYTKVVVEALSDRVTWWMTLNEPQCFIMNGYLQGEHAPFKRKYLSFPKLSKNCMLAHAEAVKIIRENAKKQPKVGIALASGCFIPEDESPEKIEEARRKSLDEGIAVMNNRWWMDPLLAGKGVSAFGIYSISQKVAEKIYQPLDFVGLNIYTSLDYQEWMPNSKSKPGLPRNALGWVIDERVMYWNLRFIYDRYRIPVMITENGLAANDTTSLDGKVHDPQRADFIKRYLSQLKRAAKDNIPVLGYLHWSVMDNFEWAEGYDPRFGLIFVDYESGKRIVKDSAWEYKKIIETNAVEL